MDQAVVMSIPQRDGSVVSHIWLATAGQIAAVAAVLGEPDAIQIVPAAMNAEAVSFVDRTVLLTRGEED